MNSFTADVAQLAAVPVELVHLVVLVEDKRFWTHPGVDALGMARALLRCVKAGRIAEGGSTIPEQLLKMGRPRARRTLRERAVRAANSLALVGITDRQSLLRRYLASVYMGRNYYGASAAARGYFAIDAIDLRPAQSFFLAERIAAPNRFNAMRIANILARHDVSETLGADSENLPGVYGRFYGPAAASQLERILGDNL